MAVTVRIECAAITRGCHSALVYEDGKARRGAVVSDYGRRMLELNGWRLDHGRWICAVHPAPPAPPVAHVLLDPAELEA